MQSGPSFPDLSDERKRERSPFLDLPTELRNLIYEYSALDAKIYLRPENRGTATTSTALSAVSRQIRDEYSKVSLSVAPPVEAFVDDLDFTHVLTYLDNLAASRLLTSGRSTQHHRLHIRLRFTYDATSIKMRFTHKSWENIPSLQTWIDRLPGDGGIIPSVTTNYMAPYDGCKQKASLVITVYNQVYKMFLNQECDDPRRPELKKIEVALYKARGPEAGIPWIWW